MQIPSTRAMMRSARVNGKLIDYDRADFFDALYSISTSFKKSEGFQKATILAGPDYETALNIFDRESSQNGEEAGRELLEQFIAGLNKKYKARITNDPTKQLVRWTPWAEKYMDRDEGNHPDAVAIPQDYWGFVVQPGDSVNNWEKPLVNIEEINKFRNDFEPVGTDRRFGLVVDPWDDRERGLDRGFVIRPGYGVGRKTHAEKYLQNISNAQIAFENGKETGINGPESELRALTMLNKQFSDAKRSGDPATRAAAEMYQNYMRYLLPSWYNPRSYHLDGYGNVALRSPEQIMEPKHGMPGSSFWEETVHGIDNTAGANLEGRYHTTADHLSMENPIIFSGLRDDFLTRFGGDPEKILEHAKDIIQGWNNPGGGRYADHHEYLELLNHMYNIGTEGKDAPGPLGFYANHKVKDKTWDPDIGTRKTLKEAFNSLTNGRMTGNQKGVETIKQNMPHANKAAEELYKQANDLHKDRSDKVDFGLGIA